MSGGTLRSLVLAASFLMICPSVQAADSLGEDYLDAYFRMFPTRATEAGRHDLDTTLEDFSAERLARWIAFNETAREKLQRALRDDNLSLDQRLDAEALLAQIARELHALQALHRLERDPLYWSSTIANAAVFLLVRDDLPLRERQRRARARVRLLPRFAEQARENFRSVAPAEVSAELCRIAVGQLRASAKFFREGFPKAAGGDKESHAAAAALEDFAEDLEKLAARATGSPRLGTHYAETFRLGTGVDTPVDAVLAQAVRDLAAKRVEAAEYGRSVWSELMPNEPAPEDATALLRRLFERVAAEHDDSVESYETRWQESVRELEEFVRAKHIITLPDPLTLVIDRSPSFFVGQSVGGVYASGPYAPEAKTILFLPMPSASATDEERAGFFRAFNRAFNRMIVPHELIPGHYVQLKFAARHPHKVRAVFPDPIYLEGWGTFCERLLLDEGWGGPLPRLAHLKKQLENIARTIVDIRVHTQEMPREEVIRFAKEEALQDDQFAANLWTRAITSSPQITTYYLGYAKVREVFAAAQEKDGAKFELKRFMDGMMRLGPVGLQHYLAAAKRGEL